MSAHRSPLKILFLLNLIGTSCRERAPSPPPMRPERAPLQVDVAPAAVREDPPYAGIPSAHVAASGCRFVGTTGDELHLAYRGERFAVATTTSPITLTLGEGGRLSSIVFSIFGWDLDAGMPDDGVPLHAQEPLGFADVYDPFSDVALSWETKPTFRVAAPTIAGPSFIGPRPTLTPRCDAVGLTMHEFPERPRPPVPATWSELIEDTGLSATAMGPAVAMLPKGVRVATYGSSGARTEVVYRKEGFWRGWVARQSLRASPAEVRVGRLSGRHVSPRRFKGFKCPSPIILYLRKAGDHFPIAAIGVVRAHVSFQEDREGYRVLAGEQRTKSSDPGTFVVEETFELVVEGTATAQCSSD